ncbi:MAG: hypothetical protein IPI60_02030 [Saprospiraceae bacterium]|nr:hypothetical protein [Saprospiraceae bacterium]
MLGIRSTERPKKQIGLGFLQSLTLTIVVHASVLPHLSSTTNLNTCVPTGKFLATVAPTPTTVGVVLAGTKISGFATCANNCHVHWKSAASV